MAELNPGQENIAFNKQSNQPLINANVSWDENTPLEDIKTNFKQVGDQYNDFVQNAVHNVADRQIEHIGNNFGASPYNEHTYYEPGATSFASAMRQQGTQAAFEEGMTRGIREAQDKLNAAKKSYNDATTAYNDAYNKYQQSKNNITYATIDNSMLPEGVNADEFANWLKAEPDPVKALALSVGNTGLDSFVKNWNEQSTIDATKQALGENSDVWQAYARHMEERKNSGQEGVSERFGDTLEGRQWANAYVKAYYKTHYSDEFSQKYDDAYHKLSSLVYNMYETRTGQTPWDTAAIPVTKVQQGQDSFEWQYIDIIQPEVTLYTSNRPGDVRPISGGDYYIGGERVSKDVVAQTMAAYWGLSSPVEASKKMNIMVWGKENPHLRAGGGTRKATEGQKKLNEEISKAFSGSDNAEERFARVETAPISVDSMAEAIMGVTVKEAKAITKMQADNPEGFKKLSDSITRSIADVSVFDVADGEREFFVDGEWKVLDAGTVVAHVPNGALDADGNVIDEDLKRMVEVFQSKDDPTLDSEKAAEEFEAAREKYTMRVVRARALSNTTDGSIDGEIYGSFLLYDDWNTYKDKVKIDGKNAEDVLAEFKRKVESDPDGAYDDFTKLWELAYKNVGYFYKQGENGLEAQSLYDANGNPTIGRVEETKDGLKYNERSNIEAESNRAMALITLYAGSMDRYNNGSKTNNIDPGFLGNNPGDWVESTWHDMLRNIEADVKAITGGISAIGNMLGDALGGGEAVRKYNGDIAAYMNDLGARSGVWSLSDKDNARTMKDLWEGKFGEGSLGYTQEHDDQAVENITKALNPLSDMIWGLNEGRGQALKDGSWDWLSDITSGLVSFGGTMVAEALVGGLVKAGVNVVVSGVKGVAAKGARALLNGVQGASLKSVLDDASRIAAADLANPTEDLMQRYVGGKAVNAADDVAKAAMSEADNVLSTAAKTAAGKVDDAAAQITKETGKDIIEGAKMVPTFDQLDDLGKATIKSLNSTANDTTNWFMRALSKMANTASNFDDFAIRFSDKAMSYITPQGIKDAMVKQGFKGITDDVVEVAYQATKRNLKEIGLRAAQMPYQNAVVSAFTGLAPELVANAGDDVTRYLSKMIGDYYENGAKGFWRGVGEAGGKRTIEGIKKVFRDILESSMTAEARVAAGVRGASKLSVDDVVRTLARNGWDSKRIQLMAKEMLLSRGAVLEDMARDLVYGYAVPQLDENMQAQHTTAEQWFTSGQALVPIGQAVFFKGVGAVIRRGQSAVISKQLDKAYRALSSTALDTDGYTQKALRVQALSNKADKLANKMLDKSLDFGHMNELSKRAADMVEKANQQMLDGIKTNAFKVDPKFNADSFEQFAEWLKKRPDASDAVVTLYKNSMINATNFFEKFARSMGYYDGPGRLATLEDPKIIGKIWDVLDKTAAENRASIKADKRLRTVWDKQAAMRKLQKKAVMDVLRDSNGISLVRDLESSLDSMFEAWDDVAKRNVADGILREKNVRLGFLPTSGILIGEADDGVPQALRGLVLGDAQGSGIATTVADPTLQREINITDLIRAFRNGEKTYTYSTTSQVKEKLPDGKEVIKDVVTQHTVPVNPKGFNFLDATIAYRNSNDLHRSVGEVLGTGRTSMGKAALQNGYVQMDGETLSKSAATLDRKLLKQDLDNFTNIINTRSKAKMTDEMAKEQNAARKALSKHAKQENNLLRAMGQQEARAEMLAERAKAAMQEAKDGRRPEGVTSMAEILGLNRSNYKQVTDDARAKIKADIKAVQQGTMPQELSWDTWYQNAIQEAARRDGAFDYDLVARRILIDNYSQGHREKPNFNGVLVKRGVKAVDAAEKAGEGISTLRKVGTNEHFGNPFSPLAKTSAEVKTKSIAEAVENFEKWLDGTDFKNVEPERRVWILSQIESGALKDKTLLYYTDKVPGGDYYGDGTRIAKYDAEHPSHADILAKKIYGDNPRAVITDETTDAAVNAFDSIQTSVGGRNLKQLSDMNMDKPSDARVVKNAITNAVHGRATGEQIDRVLTDVMAQASTIMKDATKDVDNDEVAGGFARGFFTYLDIVDRLMPDPDTYQKAIDLKLTKKLNTMGEQGVTLKDLQDAILETITVRKQAEQNVSDLVTAYYTLKGMQGSSQRAVGLGDFQYGGKRLSESANLDDETMEGSGIGEAISNMGASSMDANDIQTNSIDNGLQRRLDAWVDSEFKKKQYKGKHVPVDGIPANFFTKDEMLKVRAIEVSGAINGDTGDLSSLPLGKRLALTRNARSRYNDFQEKMQLSQMNNAKKIDVEVDDNMFASSTKDEIAKNLETTRDVLNKITNNRSPYFNEALQAKQALYRDTMNEFKGIRDEINNAMLELAKTDKDAKKLIENAAARRASAQTEFGKTAAANATYDAAAALGVARPGSMVTYGTNPAQYNAIAAKLSEGSDQAMSIVRDARTQEKVPHARSILDLYRNPQDIDVSGLSSITNMDAGTLAGVYNQMDVALAYLEEKGVDTSKARAKMEVIAPQIGDLNHYGDIFGTVNSPEMSLVAALAEIPDKGSYFPDGWLKGVDNYQRGRAGFVPEFGTIDVNLGGDKYFVEPTKDGGYKLFDADNNEMDIKKIGDSDAETKIQKALSSGKGDRVEVKLGDRNFTVEVQYTAGSELGEDAMAVMSTDTGGDQVFMRLLDEDGFPVDFDSIKDDAAVEKINAALKASESNDNLTLKRDSKGGNLFIEDNSDRYSYDKQELFRTNDSFDDAWTRYLIETQDKPTQDELMKQANDLLNKSKRAESKGRQLGEKRLEIEEGDSATTVNKALKKANLNNDPQRWLTADEYAKYKEIKANYDRADNFLNGKTNIYHSLDGGTYTPGGAGYSNFVRVSDYLKTLGYEVGQDGSWTVKGNATRKQMTKSLKKSYAAAKKNWGKAVDNSTQLPDGMDAASAHKTVANILKFINQVRDSSHATVTDLDRIWVDRSYLELLSRFNDMPLNARGITKVLGGLSNWSQMIQQTQLAGGFGAVNALTLRQAFSAVMEDPKKIFKFMQMFFNFRNSRAATNMVLERKDILTKIALRAKDESVVTDLIPAMSKRVGRDDGGVIQTLATHTLDWLDPDKTMAHVPKGIRENLSQYITEWFEDPTFQVAMPIMRAQMMVDNYDAALSHFNKKYAKRIGVDMTLDEIEDAALLVAYNRTQKFFTPHKYWSANYEEGMKRIQNESIRKTVSKITGEGSPTTMMDLLTNAFFALRYKQTFANRMAQGGIELTKQPFLKMAGRKSLEAETQYMIGKGQAQAVKTMLGLTVLAGVWCQMMGVPTAFDDFDFAPQGDETFHMPTVLTKFQNMGQIWLPNDKREDGTPYVNTSKPAYKLDPFFSMFTMPNTIMRTVDGVFNGATTKYKAPQRGLPFLSVNNPINQFINWAPTRAIGDELIGSNLLSPFKAMYEVITNSTYFGNNVWEKKYLPDGRENPNYDPGRNVASSVMHILGLDEVLDPNGYNRWVKGGDAMVEQDQVGTIAGSGVLQHEYFSAALALLEGDVMEAAITAGELPIKTEKLSSGARTNMNTVVKNALDHYGDEYRRVVESGASANEIDKAYATYMKKSADAVQKWNAKYGYLLGKNQELVPAMTRLVTAMTSGEYDDAMAYVQHAYWKASKELQIESGEKLFLSDDDLSQWLADGGTAEEFVAERTRRSKAYNKALDEEWEARKALREAGIPEEYLEAASYEDLRAEQRSISRKIYEGIIGEFAKPVGEFDNYKAMQTYYEEMIANTDSKKTKKKLADQYNTYVLDIIAKAINKYGPGVLVESSVDRRGIAQQISDYLIIPADKYYTGKSPKTNFLRDIFGVGYRNKVNLPSDDEYEEEMRNVASLMSKGKTASAMAKIESIVSNVKNGRLYVSDVDYSKLIQLKSMLRSKQ